MYSFYVQRGHKLEDLHNLSVEDKMFYMTSMEIYYENLEALLSSKDKPSSPDNAKK